MPAYAPYPTYSKVTDEFTSGNVLHDGNLQKSNKEEDLEGTGGGDLHTSLPTGGDIRETGSGKVNLLK
jgi:hypothetical protein